MTKSAFIIENILNIILRVDLILSVWSTFNCECQTIFLWWEMRTWPGQKSTYGERQCFQRFSKVLRITVAIFQRKVFRSIAFWIIFSDVAFIVLVSPVPLRRHRNMHAMWLKIYGYRNETIGRELHRERDYRGFIETFRWRGHEKWELAIRNVSISFGVVREWYS